MSRKALSSPYFVTFAVVLAVLLLPQVVSRLCYAEEAPPSKKPPVKVEVKVEKKAEISDNKKTPAKTR